MSVLALALASLLVFLQSESSVSACCRDTTTSGSAAASANVSGPPGGVITAVASIENSLSMSTFLVGLVEGMKHLFSDLEKIFQFSPKINILNNSILYVSIKTKVVTSAVPNWYVRY